MRRFVVPLLVPAALLAACSAPMDEPIEPAVVTSSPSAEMIESPDATVEPTPEPSEADPSTPESEDAPNVDTDLDLQDGVRTNDFGRMPTEIGDLALVSKETDPAEHSVRIVYETPEGKSKAQFMANFPFVDGEPAPLVDSDNEAYREEIESAVASYEDSGAMVDTRSVSAGGLEWDCVEAVGPENIDSTLCVSVKYGRVLDVQHITVHDDDMDAWRQTVDKVLADVGEGVVALA